jgi:hypothetical protein
VVAPHLDGGRAPLNSRNSHNLRLIRCIWFAARRKQRIIWKQDLKADLARSL